MEACNQPAKHKLLPFACGGVLLYAVLHILPFVGLGALSCTTAHEEAAPSPAAVFLWRDPATGCYWLYTAGSELTPRLDDEGDHVCTDRKGNRLKKTGVLGVEYAVPPTKERGVAEGE